MIQIITVTLDDQRIDCKVQGSPLSVAGYAHGISMAIRGVARLFAEHSNMDEEAIVQEIIRVVDADPARQVPFESGHIH